MAKKPVMLMILDGFGIAPAGDGNAVAAANKPNYDKLVANYPHSQLQASGWCNWNGSSARSARQSSP